MRLSSPTGEGSIAPTCREAKLKNLSLRQPVIHLIVVLGRAIGIIPLGLWDKPSVTVAENDVGSRHAVAIEWVRRVFVVHIGVNLQSVHDRENSRRPRHSPGIVVMVLMSLNGLQCFARELSRALVVFMPPTENFVAVTTIRW